MRIARGISIANTSKPISTVIVYDADAVAFFTAASITDTNQKSAVNTLVLSLKSANIWSKMKAIYPVVGGVASAHAVNLKTPGTYNLSFATGWTHASTGMTPNGATYADTSLIPSTAGLGQNSTSLSFYNRTTTINNGCNIGSVKAGYLDMLYIFNSSTNYSLTVNQNSSDSVTTTPVGFSLAKRTSSTNFVFQKNSTQTTITKASSGMPNTSIFIGALHEGTNTVFYQANQCAFASIGDGLTDAEASSFYTAVQNYQTTLGRQV